MSLKRLSRRSLLVDWLPVVLWAGMIFAFSAKSDLRFVQSDAWDFAVRKAGHMFAFGVLAVLLWRALASAGISRSILWSWLLATSYAGSDELHQSFTAGRHPALTDVAIDATGALMALCVLVAWLRYRRRPAPG